MWTLERDAPLYPVDEEVTVRLALVLCIRKVVHLGRAD